MDRMSWDVMGDEAMGADAVGCGLGLSSIRSTITNYSIPRYSYYLHLGKVGTRHLGYAYRAWWRAAR